MKRLLIPVLVLLLVGYLAFAEGAPKGPISASKEERFSRPGPLPAMSEKVLFHG